VHQQAVIDSNSIEVKDLQKGIYILKVSIDDEFFVNRIIKN
jgi:hypothetical protein